MNATLMANADCELGASSASRTNDWPTYGHDLGGQRYSPLKQINTSNVTKLVPAWSFLMKKEGQAFRNSQSIPILVNGILLCGISI